MVQHYLVIDQVFVILLLERINFEVEVKGANWLTGRLIIRKVKLAHVGVGQSFIYCDSLLGVEGQHALDQVNSVGIRSLEYGGKIFAFPSWEALDKFFVLGDSNLLYELILGVPYQVSYQLNLLFLRSGRQNWLSCY